MPNRIIKESICTSDTIDCLSDFEEVVFYRLIVNCDDFGRFDARAKVLSAKLFPLKNISVEQMQDAINSLRNAGLITVYFVDDRPYLQMTTWSKHQSTRAKKSKYPSPNENTCSQTQSENTCKHLHADENGCVQMSPYSYSLYENRESLSLCDAGACASACACEEPNNNDGDQPEDMPNAFGDGEPEHPGEDTLDSYASKYIVNMGGRNSEFLNAFRDMMPESLIRYGIDLANKCCKNGPPTYSYLEKILQGFVARKIKSVEQAKLAERAREAGRARSSPMRSAAQESDEFWSKVPFS